MISTDLLSSNLVLSLIWSCGIILAYYAWRQAATLAYYLRTRFRFYNLRNQCVMLVAQGIISEDDQVFQFFYSMCNKFAKDSRSLDYKSFVKHASEAVLLDEGVGGDTDQSIKELVAYVQQCPEEFQILVQHFYGAIWLSLLDSSTTLQIAEIFRLIPGFKRIGDSIIVCCGACHFLPHLWKHRQQVLKTYQQSRHMRERVFTTKFPYTATA